MVPVLTAKTSDWLNLYLAEGIRYSMQPTVPSAASTASIITAVSHFRLSGGNMTFNNYTTNDGELRFQGTMHFLEDPPQLSLLTSKDGESSTGSALQSSLTIYSTSLSTVWPHYCSSHRPGSPVLTVPQAEADFPNAYCPF